MFLTEIIFLLSILVLASAITIKFKCRQEKSILSVFLGEILLIYVFGLFNYMKIALYITVGLIVISLIYIVFKAIKKEIEYKKLFTLGTLLYVLIGMGLSVILTKTHFSEWDEFSHWGPNVKAMYYNDLFWANNKWDGVHVVYQPLAGIIEWLFLKLSRSYSEPVCYLAIDTAILTLLLPMFSSFKYKFKDFVKAVLLILAIYALIFVFHFSITSIYIDLILGVLFAIGIYVAINNEEKIDKVLFVMILLSLVLLKTSGLLLAGLMLLISFLSDIFIPWLKEKKEWKKYLKKFLYLVILLVIIFGVYKSWDIYCKANDRILDSRHDHNYVNDLSLKDTIKEFVSGVIQRSGAQEKTLSIAQYFYEELDDANRFGYFADLSFLKIFAIINIVLVIDIMLSNNKNRSIVLLASFDIGFVLYGLMLLFTFMFVFAEREGRILASLERYYPTFFIAYIINLIVHFKDKEIRNGYYLAIAAIICISGANVGQLIKPANRQLDDNIPDYVQEKAEIVINNLKPDDKVYVIYQKITEVSLDPHMFRYCISPIVMNLMDEFSLGVKKGENDKDTCAITEEEWEQKLINENYNYVFIFKSDDEFIDLYGKIFDSSVDLNNLENRIFKVEKNDNKVTLVLYK